MTKRHIFIYDLLLPACLIAGTGWIFAHLFAAELFTALAGVEIRGLGDWFVSSNLGRDLWRHRILLFCLPSLLLWLAWARSNLEYDVLNYRHKMNRPVFRLFEAILQWVEGGDSASKQRRVYEYHLATAQDTIRKLENRLREFEGVSGSGAGYYPDYTPHPDPIPQKKARASKKPVSKGSDSNSIVSGPLPEIVVQKRWESLKI